MIRGVVSAPNREEGPLTQTASTRAAARRRPPPADKSQPDSSYPDSKAITRIVLARLDEAKAEDTLTIDLSGHASIGDTMVVTSGRSNRHVGAISDHVVKDLKEAGVTGLRVAGMPYCDWVVIDAGSVIVHVFRPEVRAFYNLEKMWLGAETGGKSDKNGKSGTKTARRPT